jgi:hypothetical protein
MPAHGDDAIRRRARPILTPAARRRAVRVPGIVVVPALPFQSALAILPQRPRPVIRPVTFGAAARHRRVRRIAEREIKPPRAT